MVAITKWLRNLFGPRERIVAAAIKYDDVVYHASPPGRHHDVIFYMYSLGIRGVHVCRYQGFITNTGRYVGREEACKIAKKAKQILIKTNPTYMLFSEDVW